jgi:DNA polymerase-3 subunit alpha
VAAELDKPPEPLCRRVDARRLPAAVIDELRELIERYPGDAEFVLELDTRTGLRRLRFGAGYKVAARHAGFKAELDRLLAPAVAAEPAVA